ncbi:dolichol-P-glucose transferase [Halobacteriales archaeon SW_12_71_31]|nr:MAG: dolichol-P-glucose transferase [Halobacteriales archaeon SW_12_71_31]
MTAGVVVPAFRPDPERLEGYVRELADRFPVVRVEVDEPGAAVERRLADLPCGTGVAAGRRGKGAAITDGFEALADRADVLAFADADGSTPVDSVADVVAAVEDGAGVGVGSRRHPAADVRSHQTLARRRLGDAFAWLARRLLATDLYDYQCGAKAVRVAVWRRLREHLYEPGFAWDVELVAVAGALGLTVEEVPVTWIDRPDSTVDPLRTPLELLPALVTVRHRAKRIAGSGLYGAVGEGSTALVDRSEEPGGESTR